MTSLFVVLLYTTITVMVGSVCLLATMALKDFYETLKLEEVIED